MNLPPEEPPAWDVRDRPGERAGLVVAGTPRLPHDPETELVVAGAVGGSPRR